VLDKSSGLGYSLIVVVHYKPSTAPIIGNCLLSHLSTFGLKPMREVAGVWVFGLSNEDLVPRNE
jgi:hypothetical protein